MLVKFVKENDITFEKEERTVKDPKACPFCNMETVDIYPGDMCNCGSIVYGIYGDRVLKK